MSAGKINLCLCYMTFHLGRQPGGNAWPPHIQPFICNADRNTPVSDCEHYEANASGDCIHCGGVTCRNPKAIRAATLYTISRIRRQLDDLEASLRREDDK